MNTKNLKPFDLQAALKGEPVMLRDGSKAFIRHHETEFGVAQHYQLFGIVLPECKTASWTAQGAWFYESEEYPLDIIGMYPKTHMINGFEVPVPETEEPEIYKQCYIAATTAEHFHLTRTWLYSCMEKLCLERGLIFLNEKDAIANAKAMLGINPYEESEE